MKLRRHKLTDVEISQYHKISRRYALKISRKWGIYVEPEVIDDVGDMALCEALPRWRPRKGKLETLLYWYVMGVLDKALVKRVKHSVLELRDELPAGAALDLESILIARDALRQWVSKLSGVRRGIALQMISDSKGRVAAKALKITRVHQSRLKGEVVETLRRVV